MLLTTIAALAAALLSLACRHRLSQLLGRRDWIGDENGYLAPTPHRTLFIRLPLMRWLSMISAHGQRHPRGLRVVLALAASGALLAVVAAVGLAAHGTAALVALLLCLLPGDYHVLAARLWPEPLLALWQGLVVLLLALWPHAPGPALAGLALVTMLASLTRLEQLALLPTVLLALVAQDRLAGWWDVLWLTAPTLLAMLWVTVRNGRRHGVWLPDDTWRFNLQVMAEHAGAQDRLPNENVIGVVAARWRAGAAPAVGRPWRPRLLLQVPRRWLGMLGPDTFVEQRMMPPLGRASARRLEGLAALWVRHGYTVLAALLIAVVAVTRYWPVHAWIVLVMFMAVSTFHARTRYRVLLVPGMVAWAAPALAQLDAGDAAVVGVLGLVLWWLLARFSIIEEEPIR